MGAGARAVPDGYTITAVSGSYVVNPSLYSTPPYDPRKDFAPVALAAVSPNVLVTHPSIPANNVQELIAFLAANPGKYSFAHAGRGTTSHLSRGSCSSNRKISTSFLYRSMAQPPRSRRHSPAIR